MTVSKSEVAERLLGRRPSGNALFEPHEIGFACPICGASNEVELHWSEYNGFLWCQKCNIDIPSCLCVKFPEPHLGEPALSKKEQIDRATQVFLNTVADLDG